MIQIVLMALLTAARWPLMQTWIREHPVIAAIIVLGVFIVTLTAFRWPSARGWMMSLWAWVRSPMGREHIAMAEVHAAIVGILFAAIWAYTTNLLSTFAQLEEQAFLEAKQNDRRK